MGYIGGPSLQWHSYKRVSVRSKESEVHMSKTMFRTVNYFMKYLGLLFQAEPIQIAKPQQYPEGTKDDMWTLNSSIVSITSKSINRNVRQRVPINSVQVTYLLSQNLHPF